MVQPESSEPEQSWGRRPRVAVPGARTPACQSLVPGFLSRSLYRHSSFSLPVVSEDALEQPSGL